MGEAQMFEVSEGVVTLREFVSQQMFNGGDLVASIPEVPGYRLYGRNENGDWRSYWAPSKQVLLFSFVKQAWPESPRRWVWMKDGKLVPPTEV